jgi:hypothetical protein
VEEYNQQDDEEKLKAENQFLKMKLMLEKGASFGGSSGQELPAGIENQFLKNIMEYEKQFDEHKTIKVFDKIGRPSHFKSVAKIPDDRIDHAWEKLREYLSQFSISLSACSPNISSRELYRFTTEELFYYEMDDMNIPGMMTGFIYDEFHPDPVYDNTRLVEQNLFINIFSKSDLFNEIDYDKQGFIFNGHLYKTRESFSEKINLFKSLFNEIELTEHVTSGCDVQSTGCVVKGNYKAIAKNEGGEIVFDGDFRVELILNDMGYWNFKKIQINGFNP